MLAFRAARPYSREYIKSPSIAYERKTGSQSSRLASANWELRTAKRTNASIRVPVYGDIFISGGKDLIIAVAIIISAAFVPPRHTPIGLDGRGCLRLLQNRLVDEKQPPPRPASRRLLYRRVASRRASQKWRTRPRGAGPLVS